jgi:nucleotide sugar dehydrogenase
MARTVDLAVIGLGYVGLPLSREACRAGLTVAGLDRDAGLVASLAAGISHVDDISGDDLREMLGAGFEPTTDERRLAAAQNIAICVPTPLTSVGTPDLAAVTAATEMAARNLRPGTLVILESTTYPGTTDEVVCPLLESRSGLTAGTGFHLAYSPERIDPGNLAYGIKNTPKVVGGRTPACTSAAASLYAKLCDQVIEARSTREAEMAKLLENTYRCINIAVLNEMAIFCHELGIDLWDAISCAATKPFGFQPFYPGPGIGGHCIPVDPNYLSHKVRMLGYPFRIVELAQEINGRMPAYIVERAGDLLNRRQRPLYDSRVLLLGVTYKPDIADQREAPARPIARKLRRAGARLTYHDPYVGAWSVDGEPVDRVPDSELAQALDAADLTILIQDHAVYDHDLLMGDGRLIFDTRGRFDGPFIERL